MIVFTLYSNKSVSYMGPYNMFSRVWYYKDYAYQSVNGQCQYTNQTKFKDFFGWTKFSKLSKSNVPCTVNDQQKYCDIYGLSIPIPGQGVASYMISVFDNQIPVEYNITFGDQIFTFTFHNVNPVNTFPPGTFKVPAICDPKNHVVCESKGIADLPIVRFHHEGDASLVNHNTADFLGDAYYICIIMLGYRTSDDTQVTLYNVRMNQTFVQYGRCNNNECTGDHKNLIGHEATEGVLPFGGQCINDSPVGNWYSFYEEAQCSDNQNPGTECSWKILSEGKTIDLNCLQNIGFVDACRKDQHLPFTSAAKVLESAFQPESEGGCPPINNSKRDQDKSKKSTRKISAEKIFDLSYLYEYIDQQ
eukprot:TRINITY_DN696_c0_g1_i1.p1 TRINITY_DN696_c0_g1~~TRINITY_DN696_c0_g1_i1.p1  ORF type:complete len:361 (+),score=99.30 TRINITY_DN696_c0_g1_i1:149-1231(+)